MKIDSFNLFSGAPIIYKDLIIRQPVLFEIGKMGEQHFYDYISYFLINKEKMLEHSSNPEALEALTMIKFIILLMIEQPDIFRKISFILFMLTDRLLNLDEIDDEGFPKLRLIGKEDNEIFIFDNDDWNSIVQILKAMFGITGEATYNVKKNSAASRIAEKLKSSKKKIENMKNKGDFQPMLEQYTSILSVGNRIPLSDIIQKYTMYQLMYQLKRFNKYEEYHSQLNAMVHGAKIDKLTTWYGNMNENVTLNSSSKSVDKMKNTQANFKQK